jgi:hypothetical protein
MLSSLNRISLVARVMEWEKGEGTRNLRLCTDVMSESNLFWQTRSLTQAREDHLTYFLAAALECDLGFRQRYQEHVLGTLTASRDAPQIAAVQTQVVFRDESCRPDLLLILADKRRIACEHKLEAPETALELESGEIKFQLERYLRLPIDGVAYFRRNVTSLPNEILQHPRYIRPLSQPHFLWRDLYDSLSHGKHVVTRWLFDAFRRMGFTPAAPHVGELWPDEPEEVKQNQANFGKLWHSTSSHASARWKVTTGRRCELYLRPLFSAPLCSRVYVSPLAQSGSLLRFRCETTDAQVQIVYDFLAQVADYLPFPPDVVTGRLRNGLPFVDVRVSLYTLLAGTSRSEEQEARLFAQIVPLINAVSTAAGPRSCPPISSLSSEADSLRGA